MTLLLLDQHTQPCARRGSMSKRDTTEDAREGDDAGEDRPNPASDAPSVVGPPKPKKQKGMVPR